MASPNGSDGEPVVLTVERRHLQFLRVCFVCLRLGFLDDLAKDPSQLRDPVATVREAERLRRWHEDLERSVIVGTAAELRHFLTDYLRGVDEGNAYERVVAEHEAFAHLLRQLPQ